jgi:hypothetical protein
MWTWLPCTPQAAAVDDFEWVKVKPYAIYILAFVSAIFANMNASLLLVHSSN